MLRRALSKIRTDKTDHWIWQDTGHDGLEKSSSGEIEITCKEKMRGEEVEVGSINNPFKEFAVK